METKVIEKDVYGVVGKKVETIYEVYGKTFTDIGEALKAETSILKEMKDKRVFDSIRNFEGLNDNGEHFYYIETEEQMEVFFGQKITALVNVVTAEGVYINNIKAVVLFRKTGRSLWSYTYYNNGDYADDIDLVQVSTQIDYYKEFFKNLKDCGIEVE